MQLLLPPSETKRPGGGGVFAPEVLAHHEALGDARARVRASLERLSGDEEAAAAALKLGKKSRGELAHNLALDTSGAMPAIERYTGVLYDALDVVSLPDPARAWIDAHVAVQSALFGLIRAQDQIPAYRLSASSRLQDLDGTLKGVWRAAHADVAWPTPGWILDLRSQDYAQLAPLPAGAGSFLHVAQRSDDGQVRALNHFNKAAKGDLVRRLALTEARIDGPVALRDWGMEHGLEFQLGQTGSELTLITDLGAPAVPGAASAPIP